MCMGEPVIAPLPSCVPCAFSPLGWIETRKREKASPKISKTQTSTDQHKERHKSTVKKKGHKKLRTHKGTQTKCYRERHQQAERHSKAKDNRLWCCTALTWGAPGLGWRLVPPVPIPPAWSLLPLSGSVPAPSPPCPVTMTKVIVTTLLQSQPLR